MSIKSLIKTHLLISIILGALIGLIAIVSDSNGSVNNLLAVPLGFALIFIGYGGPVIAGLIVVWLINKKLDWITFKSYLVVYYLLVALLMLQLWVSRNETASGFGILLLPWLPIPALTIGIVYRFFINRLH